MMDQYDQNQVAEQPRKQADQGVFSLTKGLALSAVITSYILGPLLLLGGVGWLIDRYFVSGHWGLFLGLALAFVFSNWLVFKRSAKIAGQFTDKEEKK